MARSIVGLRRSARCGVRKRSALCIACGQRTYRNMPPPAVRSAEHGRLTDGRKERFYDRPRNAAAVGTLNI
ncbi:MAG: hypothetical protein ACRDTX_30105 [Pseudonocardiaceae bacterium]